MTQRKYERESTNGTLMKFSANAATQEHSLRNTTKDDIGQTTILTVAPKETFLTPSILLSKSSSNSVNPTCTPATHSHNHRRGLAAPHRWLGGFKNSNPDYDTAAQTKPLSLPGNTLKLKYDRPDHRQPPPLVQFLCQAPPRPAPDQYALPPRAATGRRSFHRSLHR